MAKEVANNTGGTLYNALTTGSKIIGTIIADSDFRIDGTVEGDVDCKGKIIIGQQGFMKGTIHCINADIHGVLEGKLDIAETLAIRETANITGEIKTKILIVEPNAVINGTCSMTNNKAKGKNPTA